MNAKEKAKELVDKFKNIDKRIYDINPDYFDLFILTQNEAKQCALIAVNEIIFANPHSNPFNTEVYSTMEYWQEVKKEIEKL